MTHVETHPPGEPTWIDLMTTDPAAAQDVVHESGSRSNFSRTILGVVAIDDGWGVILFGVLLGGTSSLDLTIGVADADRSAITSGFTVVSASATAVRPAWPAR